MKFIKSTLILSVLAASLFMTSCKKDCTAPDVAENIVGTWTVTFGTGTIEYKADGTLIDPNDDIIGGSLNSDVFTEKTYSTTNDSLYVKAASATTTNFVDATFPIVTNECDAITFSFLGINAVMTRQ